MKTHGPSPKMLVGTWLGLLVLLFLTWGAARFDLGPWNVIVAMAIAVAKMLLVGIIFMHLRYSAPAIRLFALAGFLWLLFMIILTMGDYLTRGFLF